jgi:peptidase U49-like protein
MSDQSNTGEVSTAQAVAGLFRLALKVPANIASERLGQLVALITEPRWTLAMVGGKANFYAIVPDKEVALSSAGLAALWNIAYVAFRIADESTRQRQQEQAERKTGAAPREFHDLSSVAQTEQWQDRLAYAARLFSVDCPWPSEIALPPAQGKPAGEAGKVLELFLGALGWIILHEIGHVALNHEEVIPATQRVSQEYDADAFATEWVLGDAGHGLDREFRVMAVCTAMAYLLLNQRVKGIGATHPPSIQRMRRAMAEFGVGDRSVGLESGANLLKAMFDPATIAPGVDGPQELFAWVMDRLATLFPSA